MKTALMLFKKQSAPFDTEILKQILKEFSNGGISVDTVEIISETDDLGFNRSYEKLLATADNFIISVSEGVTFNVKEIIAKSFDCELVENESALSALKKVSERNGTQYSLDYATCLEDSIVIPNFIGPFQGFMKEDKETTLVVLPDKIQEIKNMCGGYLIPYFDNKYKINVKRYTFKFFGNVEQLKSTVVRAEEIYGDKINAYFETNYGDIKLTLSFYNADSEQKINDAIRFIMFERKDDFYADTDTTLGERVFDYLKLKNLKISVAESFTGGRVVSELIKNSGASEFVHEGIVSYSNRSKELRLNVLKKDLDKVGAVSFEVAYEMTAGLIKTGNCDIAVSTTGIAGPKSDDTNKPVGLCYISVGERTGVHVYKYVLKGNREEITETAKNTALFLTIKKLKTM